MIDKIEINSHVEGGKLTVNRNPIKKAIRHFEGKDVVFTIAKRKKRRSTAQNSYYWGVPIEIIRLEFLRLGSPKTDQQVHRMLGMAAAVEMPHIMLKETVIESTGVIVPEVKSTTELTTSEFMDYIAFIQQWAAENMELDIPDPNEQTELFLNQ